MFALEIRNILASFWTLPCLSQNGKLSGSYPANLHNVGTSLFFQRCRSDPSPIYTLLISLGNDLLPPGTREPGLLVLLATRWMHSKVGIMHSCVLKYQVLDMQKKSYLSIQI